jgi:hypothetical protein
MTNLDDFLDSAQPITSDDFIVDNLDKAEWAVRKIASYEAAKREAEDLAKKRIDQIKAWLDSEKATNDKQIEYLSELVRPFAEGRLKDAKKRSLKLPCGTIGFRKAQPKFDFDNDKLLPWAKVNVPDQVETKESVKWGELKKTLAFEQGKAITKDGEVVPGIMVTEQPDSFYVKVDA